MSGIPTYKFGETYPMGSTVRHGNNLIIAKRDVVNASETLSVEDWGFKSEKPEPIGIPITQISKGFDLKNCKLVATNTHLPFSTEDVSDDGLIGYLEAGSTAFVFEYWNNLASGGNVSISITNPSSDTMYDGGSWHMTEVNIVGYGDDESIPVDYFEWKHTSTPGYWSPEYILVYPPQ